jgi:hypothetical protein
VLDHAVLAMQPFCVLLGAHLGGEKLSFINDVMARR